MPTSAELRTLRTATTTPSFRHRPLDRGASCVCSTAAQRVSLRRLRLLGCRSVRFVRAKRTCSQHGLLAWLSISRPDRSWALRPSCPSADQTDLGRSAGLQTALGRFGRKTHVSNTPRPFDEKVSGLRLARQDATSAFSLSRGSNMGLMSQKPNQQVWGVRQAAPRPPTWP